MPLRIEVIGEQGALAGAPEQALLRLADIAVADGADRDDWLEKAVASAGATARSVSVTREPRFRAVADATSELTRTYKLVMTLARQAVQARLEAAARDPKVRQRYRRLGGAETNHDRGSD